MDLSGSKDKRIYKHALILLVATLVIFGSANMGIAAPFDRAKALIGSYGCGACHNIPGIDGADGRVGPPLGGIGDRIFIAGKLHNSPENMTKWIADPQSIVPGNAMPSMGITQADAAQIATYLESLRGSQ